MKMNSPEISIKDRSVHDIHLEKAFVYVIDSNLKVCICMLLTVFIK